MIHGDDGRLELSRKVALRSGTGADSNQVKLDILLPSPQKLQIVDLEIVAFRFAFQPVVPQRSGRRVSDFRVVEEKWIPSASPLVQSE